MLLLRVLLWKEGLFLLLQEVFKAIVQRARISSSTVLDLKTKQSSKTQQIQACIL